MERGRDGQREGGQGQAPDKLPEKLIAPEAFQQDPPTRGRAPSRPKRPSTLVLNIGYGAAALWCAAAVAFVLGFYGPARLPLVPVTEWALIALGVFGPVAIMLIAAQLAYRAEGMRLASEWMGDMAARLLQPEETAARDVARVGRAVRREIDAMNAGLENASQRVALLEKIIDDRLAAITAATEASESRAMQMRERLAEERRELDIIVAAIGEEATELADGLTKRATLITDTSDAARKEFQTAEAALQGQSERLHAVSEAANTKARETARAVEAQTARLENVAEAALARTEQLLQRQERHRTAMLEMVESLRAESARLESILSTQGGELHRLAGVLAEHARIAETAMSDGVRRIEDVAKGAAVQAGDLAAGFVQETARVRAAAGEAREALESAMAAAQAAAGGMRADIGREAQAARAALEALAEEAGKAGATARESVERETATARAALTELSADAAQAAGRARAEIEREAAAAQKTLNGVAGHAGAAAAEMREALDREAAAARDTLANLAQTISGSAGELRDQLSRLRSAASETAGQIKAATDSAEAHMASLPHRAQAEASRLRAALAGEIASIESMAERVAAQMQALFAEPKPQAVAQPATPAPVSVEPVAEAQPYDAMPASGALDQQRGPGWSQQLGNFFGRGKRREDGGRWDVKSLLAAVDAEPAQAGGPRHAGAAQILETLQSLAIDIDRLFEEDPPIDLWRRYAAGERGVFASRLAQILSREPIARIAKRYQDDKRFREIADRYCTDFETMLREVSIADKSEKGALVAETYMGAQTGRIYLVLAQAAGRIT